MRFARVALAGAVVLLLGSVHAGAAAAEPGPVWGKGDRTCAPAPHADCRDVVHPWQAEHHGDLTGAKFARAKLHGAHLEGARLDGANFRGAVLRHAYLRGASLDRADFSPAAATGARPRYTPSCNPNCQGADLSWANIVRASLIFANLSGVNFSHAELYGSALYASNLTGANLTDADLFGVDLSRANLTGANLTGASLKGADVNLAIFTDVIWSNTTCPDGSVTSTGC